MAEPVARHSLLTAALDGSPPVDVVHAARIELAPSQRAGLHLHPCHVVGCVIAGTIRFQPEGQAERLLGPGDAFHEPAQARIEHFDNASDREPATFVAFYLLAQDEERLIVMLE